MSVRKGDTDLPATGGVLPLTDPPAPAAEAPGSSVRPLVAWEIVVSRSFRKLAMTFAAALAIASVAWQATHRSLIYDFALKAEQVARAEHLPARQALLRLVGVAALVALVPAVRVLRRVRRGGPPGELHGETLIASMLPLPLLAVPGFEFLHPLTTGFIVLLFSLALAWVVSREVERLPTLRDLTRREANWAVAAAVLLFVGTIGFISHWRFITFHAQLCDSSWETNAVWGIIRRGIPTISVSAWMYDGKPLPAPYFNDHVPFGDYLFAPFFALYPDPRTLVWMQAVFMGVGAIGANLVGHHWFGTRFGGVLAAWVYVLNPSVQSFCLHDIHPNILVIPSLMLAVGCMLANRPWLAAGFGLFTAICHEETPIYAAALGMFWMLSGEDKRRFRIGLALCVASVGLALFFSNVLMPAFGGYPHWSHFNLFFDERRSSGSLVRALVLNPVGAALAVTPELKLDYLVMSLIPLGGLSLFGWSAGWFLIPPLLLLVPSNSPGFFCPGMNYSAPLVPAILFMGLAGVRRVWQGAHTTRALRWGVVTYVVACALFGDYLYGNIASKSYKLEYGHSPLRRQNQYHYRDMMGFVEALPPYGPVERGLWEVINKVPPNAPVLSSWAVNPQLANRDISLALNYSGGQPPPEERVDYIVIDKLPAMQIQTEAYIARFRNNPRWTVFYENSSGVIFTHAKRP